MDPKDKSNANIHQKSAVNWVLEICQKEGAVSKWETNEIKISVCRPSIFEVVCTVDSFRGRTRLVAREQAGKKKDAKQCAAVAMLNEMGMSKATLLHLASPTVSTPSPASGSNSNPVTDELALALQQRVETLGPQSSSVNGFGVAGSSSAVSIPASESALSSPVIDQANGIMQTSAPSNTVVTPSYVPYGQVPSVSTMVTTPVTNGLATGQKFFTITPPPTEDNPNPEPITVELDESPIPAGLSHKKDLNEFCTKSGLPLPDYKVIASFGPSHAPIFAMTCVIKVSSRQTHSILRVRKNNQKVLSQCLAHIMLETLRGDLPALAAQAAVKAAKLAAEDDAVVDNYADFVNKAMNASDSGCGLSGCVEMFSHLHHFIQNRLKGDIFLQLKENLKTGAAQEKPVEFFEELLESQKENGLNFQYKFRVYNRGERHICLLEFGISPKQMYAVHGSGCELGDARMSAAQSAIDFLAELALNE